MNTLMNIGSPHGFYHLEQVQHDSGRFSPFEGNDLADLGDYKEQFRFFARTCTKVANLYVVEPDFPGEPYIIKSMKQFRDEWVHLKSRKVVDDDMDDDKIFTESFIPRFLTDHRQTKCKGFDVAPDPAKCGANLFNLWVKHKVESIDYNQIGMRRSASKTWRSCFVTSSS